MKKRSINPDDEGKSISALGRGFAQQLRSKDSRFDFFWNYTPIPKLMEPGGFFRSCKRTKCLIGANKSTKTTASVFECVMVYTGMIPPSMEGVYAHEEALRALVEGARRRPRHVRIIVQDYSKHWPETIRPLLVGDPEAGDQGMLPEAWSNWDEETHMFTGPDGSWLSIFAVDPTESIDPNRLRGPLVDHTMIDERSKREVYTESLARNATLKDGPRTVTLAFCPQDGYEDWTYHDLYGKCYDVASGERFAPDSQKMHPDIDAYRVTMRDNPSISAEAIEEFRRQFKPWEVAYRVDGMYSSRAANPYFDMETLVQWHKDVEFTDGVPIRFTPREVDEGRGLFDGRIEFLAGKTFDEAAFPVWRLWEMPQTGHRYVLTADTAMGNTDSDFQAAGIWRATEEKRLDDGRKVIVPADFPVQCMQLRMRLLKAGEYAVQCCMAATWWGECLLAYEANTESGGIVIDRSRNYANLYCRSARQKGEEENTEKRGWHSDRYSKPMMLEALYRSLRAARNAGSCPVRSQWTLAEMMSFEERVIRDKSGDAVRVETGNRPGAHDDTVIEAAIAAYICTQEFDKLSACHFSEGVVSQYRSELEELSKTKAKGAGAFSGLRKRPPLEALRRISHARRSTHR